MPKARPLARFRALAPAALALLLTLPLLGCGEEPKKPPRLTSFSPAIPSVTVGESLTIAVAYDPGDYEIDQFEWTAVAGQIDGNGQPEITYAAPAEKGDYKLTVSVTYGEEKVALDTVVKVLAPPSTPDASTPETVAPETAAPETAAPETAESPTETTPTESTAAPADAEEPAAETALASTETRPATEPLPAATETTAPAAGDTEAAAETAEPSGEPTESATEVAVTAPAPEALTEPATPAAGDTEAAAETAEPSGEPTESATEVAVTAPAPEALTEPATPSTEGTDAPAGASPETAVAPAVETEASTTVASAGTGPSDAATEAAPATTEAPAAEVAALTAPSTETPSTPPPPAAATPEPSRIDDVLARGTLRAIVQLGFEPFSFLGEDGRRVGFDVDMAREFARRWLGDAEAVELLPVPTDARIQNLVNGRGDLIAAALTDTPARREQVDFSITYFKDGQRLLVPEGAGVADVCDLRGRKIAVVGGSTSLDNIEATAKGCGFEADLVEFRRHADAVEALLGGDVEAFTSDGIALESFAKGQPLEVVGNHFSDEPYGVAVPKGDRRFRQLVDSTLAEMQADGTLAAIYQKWFGDTVAPYPLDLPAAPAAPVEVAAATTSDAPPVVEPVTSTGEPVTEYVIQPGDTLSKIAGKVWGDVGPDSWRRLYEANKALIGDDPARIEVGMNLEVPPA